jgi:hypothetical protein
MQKTNYFMRAAFAVLILLVACLPALACVGCQDTRASIVVKQVFEQRDQRASLSGYSYDRSTNKPALVMLSNSTNKVDATVKAGERAHSYQCDTAYVTEFLFEAKDDVEYRLDVVVPEGYYLNSDENFSFTTKDLKNNYKSFELVFVKGTKAVINGHTVIAREGNIMYNYTTQKYIISPQFSLEGLEFVEWYSKSDTISTQAVFELDPRFITDDIVLMPYAHVV